MTFQEAKHLLSQVLSAMDTISVRGRDDVSTMAGCMSIIEQIIMSSTQQEGANEPSAQ